MLPATVGMPTRQVPSRSMPRASGPMLVPGNLRQAPIDRAAGPAGHSRCEARRCAGHAAGRRGVRRSADRTRNPPTRHEGDEEHPRQGHAAGRPPHDHTQGNSQHDRNVQEGRQQRRELKGHGEFPWAAWNKYNLFTFRVFRSFSRVSWLTPCSFFMRRYFLHRAAKEILRHAFQQLDAEVPHASPPQFRLRGR